MQLIVIVFKMRKEKGMGVILIKNVGTLHKVYRSCLGELKQRLVVYHGGEAVNSLMEE